MRGGEQNGLVLALKHGNVATLQREELIDVATLEATSRRYREWD